MKPQSLFLFLPFSRYVIKRFCLETQDPRLETVTELIIVQRIQTLPDLSAKMTTGN